MSLNPLHCPSSAKLLLHSSWSWGSIAVLLSILVFKWQVQPRDVVVSDEIWNKPSAALQDYAFLRDRVADEHGWDAGRAEGAISEYLRFLQMIAEAPRMELIASSDVDLVWHEHLMDTSNYAHDTLTLFGRFLHHRRARTVEEVNAIPESYVRTKQHYQKRFGMQPPDRFWGATTNAASMCGGGELTGSGSSPPSPAAQSSNPAPAPAGSTNGAATLLNESSTEVLTPVWAQATTTRSTATTASNAAQRMQGKLSWACHVVGFIACGWFATTT